MEGPLTTPEGFWSWRGAHDGVEARFLGKGPTMPLPGVISRVAPASHRPSWVQQVHGRDAVEAREGCVAEADALYSTASSHHGSLALAVVTADCVPVLWAGPNGIAAIHAGWRGLAAGVIEATLGLQRAKPDVAWIGPAIGPCCYEVSPDVARRVSEASDPSIVVPASRSPRPHLDLVAAARRQLHRSGVQTIHSADCCTRCHPDWLWSYRRDGAGKGRNVAVIWRADGPRTDQERSPAKVASAEASGRSVRRA